MDAEEVGAQWYENIRVSFEKISFEMLRNSGRYKGEYTCKAFPNSLRFTVFGQSPLHGS